MESLLNFKERLRFKGLMIGGIGVEGLAISGLRVGGLVTDGVGVGGVSCLGLWEKQL